MAAALEGQIVLLADDDENDLFLIQRWFKRLGKGTRLIMVPNGEEAIAYFKGIGRYANRIAWPLPDLLILDHWMPLISGLEVLRWLRMQFPKLPVVLMSGGMSPPSVETVQQFGAAYCGKTVCTGELAQSLDQAMSTALRMAWASGVE